MTRQTRWLGGLLISIIDEWITWIGYNLMQRWTHTFNWAAALSAWLGAMLVLAAIIITVTVPVRGDGDLREESLELALIVTPILLCPVVLAYRQHNPRALNQILQVIGLIGTLALPTGFLLAPIVDEAVYGTIAWLLLGVGVWLVGVNLPHLNHKHRAHSIFSTCGIITGVCWIIAVGLFAGETTLTPLPPPPNWAAYPANFLLGCMSIAFIIWTLGTGLRLVLSLQEIHKELSRTV